MCAHRFGDFPASKAMILRSPQQDLGHEPKLGTCQSRDENRDSHSAARASLLLVMAGMTPEDWVLVLAIVAPLVSLLVSCLKISCFVDTVAKDYKCTWSITCGLCQCLLPTVEDEIADLDLGLGEPSVGGNHRIGLEVASCNTQNSLFK